MAQHEEHAKLQSVHGDTKVQPLVPPGVGGMYLSHMLLCGLPHVILCSGAALWRNHGFLWRGNLSHACADGCCGGHSQHSVVIVSHDSGPVSHGCGCGGGEDNLVVGVAPTKLLGDERGQALGIEPDELLGIDIAATELLAVEATEPRCGGIEPRGVGAKYGRTGVL